VAGVDGQQWAFTRDATDGRSAVFTLDKPRDKPSQTRARSALPPAPSPASIVVGPVVLARLPKPATEPEAKLTDGYRLIYGPRQWVVVRCDNSSKKYIPHHLNEDDKGIAKAGPEPWPLWKEDDALNYGPHHWILEAEGEKCAEWFRAAGAVAVSQPGHAHKPEAIRERYKRLVSAGVLGIVYIADNDPTGETKGRRCAAAAKGVGLPFRLLPAADVWANMPPGGSVDDATGSPADRVAALETAIARKVAEKTTSAPRSFESDWAQLEAEADRLAASDWELPKVIAALTRAAKKLDIHLTSGAATDQIEAADRRRRPTAEPIAPGGSFTVAANQWAVEGIFRHGLNLLVGQPGAGKSRLAADLAHAWVRGHETWLDRALSSVEEERHILIIGTDQGQEDWAQTLTPVGLATRNGQDVTLHPRLTLYPMGSGIRLDPAGLRLIRRWADDHPGGLVVVDSLSACLPPGVDPDKAAVRRPIQGLAEAIESGWGLLLHHTRKSAGRDRNLAVGAGSGSTQIDAACSRVVGLGLIHKMEHGAMAPQEADPRRELLSTKRGGASLHLVVSSDHTGRWRCEGSAEELKQQEREERARENLTGPQAEALDALEASGEWMTVRAIGTADGGDYDPKGAKAAALRKVLTRLEALGLIRSEKVGVEKTYRAKQQLCAHGRQTLVGSPCSPVAAQGISLAHLPAHPGSPSGSPFKEGEHANQEVSQGEPRGEPG
jgi:hypothetical protein